MSTSFLPRSHPERAKCCAASDGLAKPGVVKPALLELLEPFVGPKQRYQALLAARDAAKGAVQATATALGEASGAFDAAWRTLCGGLRNARGVVDTAPVAALLDGLIPSDRVSTPYGRMSSGHHQ